MSPEVDGDVTDESSRDEEIEQLKEKLECQQREIEALRLQMKRAETLGQRVAATEGNTIPEWTRKAAQGENLSVEELQGIHWSESSESTHSNSDYDSMKNDDTQFHCHDEQSKDDNIKSAKAKRILWISLGICFFFMICEVVGGVWAKSLAIVTDAAHLLTDFASMLISLFSLYIASRPPSQRMSFGFHRAEVLGAFFSVFLIWIVTGVLVVLAILRIINADYKIDATIMAITAGIGVFVNLVMGSLLYFGGHAHSHGGGGHSHHGHAHAQASQYEILPEASGKHTDSPNINVRAAFIHVLGDLVQSVGVLIAALIIFFKESWAIVDPICTLLFSVIVLCTTVYIMRDALVVLLEGRPNNIEFSRVFTSLEQIKGVKKVHDLRIWALTMDKVAVSVHLEVAQPQNAQSVLRDTRTMLKRVYGVHESTIQIEGFIAEKDCGRCDVPK